MSADLKTPFNIMNSIFITKLFSSLRRQHQQFFYQNRKNEKEIKSPSEILNILANKKLF